MKKYRKPWTMVGALTMGIFMVSTTSSKTLAHAGHTDSHGCHTTITTAEYHCHERVSKTSDTRQLREQSEMQRAYHKGNKSLPKDQASSKKKPAGEIVPVKPIETVE